ncbi:phosphoadenylyl-sulfate reductase [Angustibacter sp. Root456]|uniref:phosphoadenylyl-sulfate reductase n=1 Tax=Angustibacter sp. Root456 TaxID=1736539 RepID=UPI0006F553CF|nr:phosphoadenylyl-sulfate reductase [Angustibacter sp. Root456]KQX62096.1 phosphoadenosine phosphosulfate reductase [Angustibacter sp. Root456]
MSVDAQAKDQLRRAVERAAHELEDAEAADIVAWAAAAVRDVGGRLVVASSMQDAVLPHLVSSLVPGVEVLFLDTGLHFAATLATRERVAQQLPVRVVDVRPRQSLQEQAREFGPALHERDPGLCCFLRKVDPLARALEPYAAWVTGVRREDSPTRSQAAAVAWDEAHDLLKVNPLVRWTNEQLLTYESEHDLVRNPLRDNGFPSIGCEPCTRRVEPGEDPRAGRWSGRDKTECGIHA